MEEYRLYWLGQAKIKPGKNAQAAKWWQEKGAPDILSDHWTKSLRCFATQFGLSGDYSIEIWQELENYEAFDKMDQWFLDYPEKAKEKLAIWDESNDYFEWGSNRLFGNWPESLEAVE